MKEGAYYNWHDKVEKLVPEDMRIGDDLIIMSQSEISNQLTEPRKVDVTTFIILDSGTSKVLIEGREYALQAPCIGVVLPGQTYYPIDISSDLAFRAVIMSRRFTDGLFGLYNGTTRLLSMIKENPILDISSDLSSFNTYYNILLKSIRSGLKIFRLETAKHLTLSMLYYYSRKLENAVMEKNRRQIKYEQFLSDVRANLAISRRLPFYAGKLGVSVTYLTELVKEKRGMTAAEYIDEQVVIECKALLNSTTLSINQISRMMNFPSPSVFGKFFKNITGVSPTDYRDNCRHKQNEKSL